MRDLSTTSCKPKKEAPDMEDGIDVEMHPSVTAVNVDIENFLQIDLLSKAYGWFASSGVKIIDHLSFRL